MLNKQKLKKYIDIIKENFSDEFEIQSRIEQISLLSQEERQKPYYKKKYHILYGIEKGNELCEKKKKEKFKLSRENMIIRYGFEEGNKKWDLYQNDRKLAYKKRKELGIKQNNGLTLESLINKYGKEKGEETWFKKSNRQKYRFSIEYFKDNFTNWEEEHEKYLSSMNHTSKKAFIKKYGEEDGTKRFNEYSKKQSEGFRTSLQCFIEKYGKELGKEKYQNWLDACMKGLKNFLKKGYSKISQKLFWEIYEQLSDKSHTYFAELNGEYWVRLGLENYKFCFLDFKSHNHIIEFQGNYWHKKPEQIERDKIKKEELEKRGYKVLHIFEKEYKENSLQTLLKCLEFLKN